MTPQIKTSVVLAFDEISNRGQSLLAVNCKAGRAEPLYVDVTLTDVDFRERQAPFNLEVSGLRSFSRRFAQLPG